MKKNEERMHKVSGKSRQIPLPTKLLLAVMAGGRCEFGGCNKYLFEHPVTLRGLNLTENAHIYPFSRNGPRGDEPGRPDDIHNIENLMLLCPDCHNEIDKNKQHYPVARLRSIKQEHEERIRYLTGLAPESRTMPLIVKSRIAGRPVDISFEEVRDAVAPRYPADKKGFVIDLTELGDENSETFYQLAAQRIRQKMREFYSPGVDNARPQHICVFALAPIPLLVTLGECLSDKIDTALFQRHRVADNPWQWRSSGNPVRYKTTKTQAGTELDKIAILLSLSGKIDPATVPRTFDARFTIYEMTLDGISPDPGFLRRREDLDEFRHAYRNLLSAITASHGTVKEVHLLPAVPAPVAVMCGHEVLPKVQPALLVYDNDKAQGGFVLRTKVHDDEQRKLSA